MHHKLHSIALALASITILSSELALYAHTEPAFARIRALALCGALLGLAVLLAIVAQLYRRGALMTRTALLDELTGLYNRRGFTWMAEHRMRLADRHRKPLHLLFIDLDEMKQINDRYGHEAGDTALITTARMLETAFRESDVVARLGGDEFVVLAEADDTAERQLYERIWRSKPPELSLSIGSALYDPEHPVSLAQLLAQADRDMYRHKRQHVSERRPLLSSYCS